MLWPRVARTARLPQEWMCSEKQHTVCYIQLTRLRVDCRLQCSSIPSKEHSIKPVLGLAQQLSCDYYRTETISCPLECSLTGCLKARSARARFFLHDRVRSSAILVKHHVRPTIGSLSVGPVYRLLGSVVCSIMACHS